MLSQIITGIFSIHTQIFLTIVWFVFEPPGVRADSPEGKRDEVILKCRVKGKSFILSLVYNMILITTCTIYAVKTRKIPENFNESKFIGFTMYTTIVIWLAFVTMFFGTNNSYEVSKLINTFHAPAHHHNVINVVDCHNGLRCLRCSGRC